MAADVLPGPEGELNQRIFMSVVLCVAGGAPDTAAMTGGKFSSGMTGCVRNLTLMNARPGQQPAQAIDLQAHAAHGVNVQPCPS